MKVIKNGLKVITLEEGGFWFKLHKRFIEPLEIRKAQDERYKKELENRVCSSLKRKRVWD